MIQFLLFHIHIEVKCEWIIGGGGGGTDNIAKLRIELKSILLEIPSNKIKDTYTYIKLTHL